MAQRAAPSAFITAATRVPDKPVWACSGRCVAPWRRNPFEPTGLGAVVNSARAGPPAGGPASLLRPCATSAGFLATRDPPWRMDMAGLRGRLSAAGYAIVVDARIILIVRRAVGQGPAVESSVYDNGKVLLKTTDRPAAEAAFADLEPHLASCRRA